MPKRPARITTLSLHLKEGKTNGSILQATRHSQKTPIKTKRNIKTIFQISWSVKRFLNHSAYKEQVPDPKPAESHVQASDPLSHQRQDGISLPLNSFPASSRMAAGGWHRCPGHLTRCLRGTRAATVTHHFLPPQHGAHGQGPGSAALLPRLWEGLWNYCLTMVGFFSCLFFNKRRGCCFFFFHISS